MKVAERMFSREFDNTVVPIHDPINPAEVYRGDSISAIITNPVTSEVIEAQVYRLSPLGVEVLIPNDKSRAISVGDFTSLSVKIAGVLCAFDGIKVASMQSTDENSLVGFRWCGTPPTELNQKERRGDMRWMCGEHYLPTGIAPNPARFNDFIYFAIRDISTQGMQLSTSLRNKFLIPGMVLDARISFPLIGQVDCKLKIVNARIIANSGKETLSLGVQLLQKTQYIEECVGQYLLQFGSNISVKELRKSGWKVRSTDHAVSYSFVKSAEDYRKILALRHLAYSSVGKSDRDANDEVMSDMYDTQSRILMAQHGSRTVGSWRITFHTPDERNEYEQYVKFPDNFYRKDEIVVLSRICTDPEYRGSDLFYGMMRQCLIASLQSKRRYILGGCSKELLPLYLKVGFKPWDLYFEHGGLNKVKEQIIVADAINIISGKDVDIGVWNEIYSDLSEYLVNATDVPFDPSMNFRVAAYKTLAPLSKIMKFFSNSKQKRIGK